MKPLPNPTTVQVVLTSSLEDSAFGVSGIKYLNWFAQVSLVNLFLQRNANAVQYFLASIIISLFFMSMSIKPQTYASFHRYKPNN